MFTITLKAARISCGYSLKEVADYCEISQKILEEYEADTSLIPCSILKKIWLKLNIPLMLLFIGKDGNMLQLK